MSVGTRLVGLFLCFGEAATGYGRHSWEAILDCQAEPGRCLGRSGRDNWCWQSPHPKGSAEECLGLLMPKMYGCCLKRAQFGMAFSGPSQRSGSGHFFNQTLFTGCGLLMRITWQWGMGTDPARGWDVLGREFLWHHAAARRHLGCRSQQRLGGGYRGTIVKWNGVAWSAQTSGTMESIGKVWGTDANSVWAVGTNGTILRWDGSRWSSQVSGTTEHLTGIWGSDASNVWAVGNNGIVLRWNGVSWSRQSIGTTQSLNSVWGTDASNIWLWLPEGLLARWNGKQWSLESSGTTDSLYNLHGSDENNIWAVGWRGRILKWNGNPSLDFVGHLSSLGLR